MSSDDKSHNSVAGGASTAARPSKGVSILKVLLRSREANVVFVFCVLCVAMLFTSARDAFFDKGNWQNILLQLSLLSIYAIGETLVIITGGIDLSLGSLIAFSGMILALMLVHVGGAMAAVTAIGLCIVITLVIAAAIGWVHATLVHKLLLPPFVVTLASLLILRSQSLISNKQLPVSVAEYPKLLFLANGKVFGLPVPLIIMLVIAATVHLLLTRSRVGRYLFSIGSNEQATKLSGVNVYKVKLFAYCASALCGGLAGILYAAYGGQGDPLCGNGYEMDAVAASVVGGANLMGGEGSIIGTVLGALLLHTIYSSINLTLSSPDIWRGTVVGSVLLFAVLVTAVRKMRAA